MEKLNPNCPNCGNRMVIRQLSCGACGVSMEGEIPLPKLARLAPEDREFVELFVVSGGSLKEVGTLLGVSYPTVRQRLDKIILRLRELGNEDSGQRLETLGKLERGEITVEDAVKLLKNLN